MIPWFQDVLYAIYVIAASAAAAAAAEWAAAAVILDRSLNSAPSPFTDFQEVASKLQIKSASSLRDFFEASESCS